jgi:hypothetical protein
VEIREINFFQMANDDDRLLRFQQLGSVRIGPIGRYFEGPGRAWAEQKAAANLRGPFV